MNLEEVPSYISDFLSYLYYGFMRYLTTPWIASALLGVVLFIGVLFIFKKIESHRQSKN